MVSLDNSLVKFFNLDHIFMPPYRKIGGILFYCFLSVSLSVCLNLTLSQTSPVFTCLQNKSFENTVGKGEIALRAISPFPTVFSNCLENCLPFSSN